jgi:hypothetical protein
MVGDDARTGDDAEHGMVVAGRMVLRRRRDGGGAV